MVLPRRALAGSIGGKALEAGTLAGLVLLVPRALGPADYGSFAVALAVATGLSTATGVGGPSLFARALGPLDGAQRDELARALTRRLGVARSRLVAVVVLAACGGAALAPHRVSMLQAALVLGAVAFGSAATLLSQLALGLERTVAWSLRYPLENGVIVGAALVLYPLAGLNGAIAAIALGAIAAFGLGLATVGRSLLTAPEGGRRALPASVVRFARLQAAAGLLSQTVQRGAAPACALLGVGATATGHAAIAAGAALAIVFAVTQTTLVVLPGAARTFALDPARARALLCHVALVATAVVVPVCIVVAVAADRLLALTLGDPFRGAAPALRIALAAAALAPAWALSMQLAAVGDQPEAVLTGAAAGAATFVVVAALALPGGGAVAGAEAMVAGFGVSVLATLAALRVMAVGRH